MAKRKTAWSVAKEEPETVTETEVKSPPVTVNKTKTRVTTRKKTAVPIPASEVEGDKEVLIGAMLPMKARTELKRLGADHGKNQKQLLMEAIDKLLVSYGKEPVFK